MPSIEVMPSRRDDATGVLTAHRAIESTEYARAFWAACIVGDEQIDPIAGTVASSDPAKIDAISEVAMSKVQRAELEQGFSLPESASEIFASRNGCMH